VTPAGSLLADVRYTGARLTATVTSRDGPRAGHTIEAFVEVTGLVPLDHWTDQLRDQHGQLPAAVEAAYQQVVRSALAEDTASRSAAAGGPPAAQPVPSAAATQAAFFPPGLARAVEEKAAAVRAAGGFVLRPAGHPLDAPPGAPHTLKYRSPRSR